MSKKRRYRTIRRILVLLALAGILGLIANAINPDGLPIVRQ